MPQPPRPQAAQGVAATILLGAPSGEQEALLASRRPGRNVLDGRGRRRGPWALTVHAGGPGSGGARDLPLSAGTAGRLPGDRPPRLAAVAVQRHNLTGAGGQLTCKRRTGGLSGRALGASPHGAHTCPRSVHPPGRTQRSVGMEPAPRGTSELPSALRCERRHAGDPGDPTDHAAGSWRPCPQDTTLTVAHLGHDQKRRKEGTDLRGCAELGNGGLG